MSFDGYCRSAELLPSARQSQSGALAVLRRFGRIAGGTREAQAIPVRTGGLRFLSSPNPIQLVAFVSVFLLEVPGLVFRGNVWQRWGEL